MTLTTEPRAALSDTNVDILEAIYRHRLLDTTQLHHLLTPDVTRRTLHQRLERLVEYGYVMSTPGPPPAREFRWLLPGPAADLVESLGTSDPRPYRMNAHRAAASRHLLAVNDVGVALTAAARDAGDEFDWRSWTHEIALSTGPGSNDRLIADAVLTYDVFTPQTVSSQWRFLELDRGHESVHTLVGKIRGYRAYATYSPAPRRDQTHLPAKLWQREYPVLPGVLFVFADVPRRKVQRRIQALAGYVAADPYLQDLHRDGLQVAATTLEDLQDHGPHEEVFVGIPTLERTPLLRTRLST